MEKLILGILMLRKLTVYEIRNEIKRNLNAMCSDSLGSIQAAIKRLLDAEMVTFSEYVEKSVNKKQYAITDKGRKELIGWLQVPANVSGSKNMEFGKLLFMGMLPAEERSALIDEIIANLEKDLEELLTIQSTFTDESRAMLLEYWKTDMGYYGFVAEKSKEVNAFRGLTLQYGIDTCKFNIEWFEKLREINISI
ncbi:MAG: PadR family transcriptional regulator [Defluviitaleaceae bacterium]|nr:PadR family transcriptional regulator [Defluviitaleaceae bacterium]